MKISVIYDDKTMNIRIPSRLIFNSVTATIAGPAIMAKIGENNGGAAAKLERKTVRAVFREINRCRQRYKDWNVVEVESDGRIVVQIRL